MPWQTAGKMQTSITVATAQSTRLWGTLVQTPARPLTSHGLSGQPLYTHLLACKMWITMVCLLWRAMGRITRCVELTVPNVCTWETLSIRQSSVITIPMRCFTTYHAISYYSLMYEAHISRSVHPLQPEKHREEILITYTLLSTTVFLKPKC